MDVTERFGALVQGPEADLDAHLDEATLLVAAHAHEGLDVPAYLATLDDMAEGCAGADLDGLLTHLFVDLGFRGNADDYHDPRNSYLDDVIDRRLGIPITLAVVAMSVGRRAGVPLVGIGMPGHFLLRHEERPRALLDPFSGGRRVEPDEAETMFRASVGPGPPFDAAYLEPVGARAILARVLANLRVVASARGDAPMLEWVLRLRTAIPGTAPEDLAELAGVLSRLGRMREAAAALDRLADQLDGDARQATARSEAARLRARLN